MLPDVLLVGSNETARRLEPRRAPLQQRFYGTSRGDILSQLSATPARRATHAWDGRGTRAKLGFLFAEAMVGTGSLRRSLGNGCASASSGAAASPAANGEPPPRPPRPPPPPPAEPFPSAGRFAQGAPSALRFRSVSPGGQDS